MNSLSPSNNASKSRCKLCYGKISFIVLVSEDEDGLETSAAGGQSMYRTLAMRSALNYFSARRLRGNVMSPGVTLTMPSDLEKSLWLREKDQEVAELKPQLTNSGESGPGTEKRNHQNDFGELSEPEVKKAKQQVEEELWDADDFCDDTENSKISDDVQTILDLYSDYTNQIKPVLNQFVKVEDDKEKIRSSLLAKSPDELVLILDWCLNSIDSEELQVEAEDTVKTRSNGKEKLSKMESKKKISNEEADLIVELLENDYLKLPMIIAKVDANLARFIVGGKFSCKEVKNYLRSLGTVQTRNILDKCCKLMESANDSQNLVTPEPGRSYTSRSERAAGYRPEHNEFASYVSGPKGLSISEPEIDKFFLAQWIIGRLGNPETRSLVHDLYPEMGHYVLRFNKSDSVFVSAFKTYLVSLTVDKLKQISNGLVTFRHSTNISKGTLIAGTISGPKLLEKLQQCSIGINTIKLFTHN